MTDHWNAVCVEQGKTEGSCSDTSDAILVNHHVSHLIVDRRHVSVFVKLHVDLSMLQHHWPNPCDNGAGAYMKFQDSAAQLCS